MKKVVEVTEVDGAALSRSRLPLAGLEQNAQRVLSLRLITDGLNL